MQAFVIYDHISSHFCKNHIEISSLILLGGFKVPKPCRIKTPNIIRSVNYKRNLKPHARREGMRY